MCEMRSAAVADVLAKKPTFSLLCLYFHHFVYFNKRLMDSHRILFKLMKQEFGFSITASSNKSFFCHYWLGSENETT